MSVYSVLLLTIRHEQGRLAEFSDVIDSLIATSPDYVPYQVAGAATATAAGDRATTRARVDGFVDDDFARVPRDILWTSLLVLMTEPLLWVGTDTEVERLWQFLLPHQGHLSWSGITTSGPIDRALAKIARHRGDESAAIAHDRVADELVARFRKQSPKMTECA